MKSLSPPTMTKALMWSCVKAISERVEGQVDVGAVLVAAGGEVALHHPDGVLRQQPAVVAGAFPVAVGDLGHDLAAFLDGLQDGGDVELSARVVLTPISMLSKSMKTAIFNRGLSKEIPARHMLTCS